MNSKIITVVKRTTSALIIALSLGAICIPAVAVKIAHKPDTALCHTIVLFHSVETITVR